MILIVAICSIDCLICEISITTFDCIKYLILVHHSNNRLNIGLMGKN